MKFSIIICTYNTANRLSKTLDSILTQACNDYEVIIIDGVSTDGTPEVIKDYEKKFAGRLQWISERDEGIYNAMNKGIDMAREEWVYFLGSDDIFYSDDILEKISKEIETSDLDVIYGNVKWGDTEKIYDGKFSVLKLMEKNICHQAIFFKKKLFDKFGKYDTRYKILADHVFNMQWFNDENIKRKYLELTVTKYNTDGLSSSAQDKKFVKDRNRLIEKYFPKEYSMLNSRIEQNKKIQQLEQELNLMKSSKFWKMRNLYMKLKSFLLFRNHA